MRLIFVTLVTLGPLGIPSSVSAQDAAATRQQATVAMKRAATYYQQHVSTHGGYVYFYSLDLQQRWGEGEATAEQIWVQPPGTPTVGMAYLEAYRATSDPFYLNAARRAAEALVYGQMRSGGWTNCIDFDPRGERVALYRNGRGRGRNISSLDDGQTQSAIRFLMHTDQALEFQHAEIHAATRLALDALLNAQFPNGGFPQVWDDDVVPDPPVIQANYPDHDWRSEGRVKNYWDMYTLNDNVTGYVAEVLIDAHKIYDDARYREALRRLGDFLILAQMPEPQPAWAQQYNYQMQPIWARRFEPPGICGDESQEVIETLLMIYRETKDRRYLEPIPSAIAYLNRSRLPDGRLARYYELQTNKPLYMVRSGNIYSLTHDDSNLPAHYGWKWPSRLQELEQQYQQAKAGTAVTSPPLDWNDVQTIVSELDEQGRWVSRFDGRGLVGQAKMRIGAEYLSSERFSENLTLLSRFVAADGR
ncbi:pectate lyase [Roseimaritima ulvae]|uniref:Pectic acid lyase n=1 Tax=Roseimaritima ulvae TaxID=980254 RepID=A0A5B9QNK3_9BACT|nr:pectate lyase [Roseimaritima ulvae]QEG39529.1 Pectic acid lyase [Roseimaritima ulvae]